MIGGSLSGEDDSLLNGILTMLTERPLLRVYLDHFNDATADSDPGLKFFRYWQILEGIAETKEYPDSQRLTDFQGRRIPGNHRNAKSRVYRMLKDWKQKREVAEIPWGDAPAQYNLWQSVAWWHAMRGCIAHHGRFAFQDNVLQARFRDYSICEEVFRKQGGLDGFILDALAEETEFVIGSEIYALRML
jgi:hypothetical protein